MRFLPTFLTCLVAGSSALNVSPLSENEYQHMYATHLQLHGLKRERHEIQNRFAIFKQKVDEIREHNADPNKTFTLELNPFSDLSSEEFRATRLGYKPLKSLQLESNDNNKAEETIASASASTPVDVTADTGTPIDWTVASGNPSGIVAVNAIQDQGQCGSCWSFATAATVEGAWVLAGHSLTKFSEQQLVACDKTDSGCNGGNVGLALNWIVSNKGICLASDYPYASTSGTSPSCSSSCKVAATITGQVAVKSESAMLAELQNGPLAIAIDASQSKFQSYKSGVYSDSACTSNLDHAVTAVGYGYDSASGLNYWLVRNSWFVF